MAQELDIFQDTTKEALFADSVMAAENQDGSGDGGQQPVDTGTAVASSYTVGEDGHYYNDDGERVYYWVPPSELGDVVGLNRERTLYQDTGGYYTEQEIRQAWNAKEGMGYLKERISWDNYWGYLTERQSLIESGELYDATGATQAGRDARQDVIREGGGLREMGGAKGAAQGGQSIIWGGYSGYYSDFLNQQAQLDLMEKYGIPSVFYNDDGDVFQWNGSSYTKTFKVDDSLPIGEMMFAVAVGLATGASGVSGLFGGGAAGGAASGAIGSAISQGIVNGKIDPTSVVTAGILGGIGGFFNELTTGELGIAQDAAGNAVYTINGEVMSAAQNLADTYITRVASVLGIPYNEAAGIVQGVLTGTVSGEDLEGIALNAIGGWSEVKIKDYLTGIFGDGIDVDNWFREGDSFIPTEAFFPFIETAIQGAIDGGVSKTDLLKMLGEYFKAGGDLDFILPQLPDLNLDFDVDFCKEFPGFPLCTQQGFDITCPKGWDKDEDGICIEPPVLCGEGYSWDPQLGKCIDGFSGQIKCPDGWDVDEDGICIEPPVVCGEGYSWDPQLGECRAPDVPDTSCPRKEIANGVQTYVWDQNLGECVPDVIECIEGFDLVGQECVKVDVPEMGCDSVEIVNGVQKYVYDTNLGECVPDVIECIEGFKLSGQECVKIPEINCDEGQEYNTELGKCVDIESPDVDSPDIDIDLPDIDVDLPSVSLGQPGSGMFSPLEAKGLSYEQQTPTPLVQSAPVDAMSGITSFINRKLNERQSDQDISSAFNSDPDKGMFS